MKQHKQTLDTLPLNTKGFIENLNCTENIKRRLLDLGLIEGSTITPILISPSKDPRAFSIRGTLIALRKEDANLINVRF